MVVRPVDEGGANVDRPSLCASPHTEKIPKCEQAGSSARSFPSSPQKAITGEKGTTVVVQAKTLNRSR